MIAEMARYTDDGMGLGEAIAAYLAACDVEGEKPPHGGRLRQDAGNIPRDLHAEGATAASRRVRGPAHVYAFLKVIAGSGVSLGTRHRRFRETRAFFSWCTRMGACAGSPFTGIPNVKVAQKVIQPLSEEAIQALLAVCDSGDEFGCRNRAIILLFLDTGMRYAELHQLTLADVSWEDRRIFTSATARGASSGWPQTSFIVRGPRMSWPVQWTVDTPPARPGGGSPRPA